MAFSRVQHLKLSRQLHTINKIRNKAQLNEEWNVVVEEAEQVAGGNSFRNLSWLLNKDLANMSTHFRKVVTTNHPMVNVARDFVENNMVSWGLIVLLFSKVVGQKIRCLDETKYATDGVLHSQYAVAKVTEMLKMSIKIHKEIVNINDQTLDLHFGNKIAILSGDFLLCECLKELANLRNQCVLEYMSSGLRDLTSAQYVGSKDRHNRPFPARPHRKRNPVDVSYLDEFSCEPIVFPNALGDAKAEWLLRTTLGGGSLLGKGCLSALKLGDHSESLRNVGFTFGKSLGLVYQAYVDVKELLFPEAWTFSLVGAPVLFHLQNNPDLYKEIEDCREDIESVNYDSLRKSVVQGSGIQRTCQMQKQHVNSALNILDIFADSDAKVSLKNIIKLIDLS